MGDQSARLIGIACATAMVISGCGQHVAPTAPGPSRTAAMGPAAVVLTAQLSSEPLSPVGPAAESEYACAGTATVTIDPAPGGIFNTTTARFEVFVTGCPPGTVVTNVYLRRMDASSYDAWIGASIDETVLANGSGTFKSTNDGVSVSRAEAVLAAPTDFGIRVTTRNNPFQFLSGQLRAR